MNRPPNAGRASASHRRYSVAAANVWRLGVVLGALILSGCWGRPESPPNFVLVSLDTLRAENLHAYGYGRETSPFIDSLAAEGVLFENAIAPAATTGPAHMSIFTGLYPRSHGVVTGVEKKNADATSVAVHLARAGYRTAAFTENGYIVRRVGFDEGFDEYTENGARKGFAPLGEVERTFGQAREWLESNAHEPFFLFVHTYQVHSPYKPPARYDSLFRDDGMPASGEPWVREARDRYDREIRFTDAELERLLEVVQRRGLADSTIVILLSDHGEEFHEHGAWQHGTHVFDEALRVPLIFWGAGGIRTPRRHETQVSLVDVAPTILDFAGIERPAWCEGISLKPAILHGEEPAERTLFAEAAAGKQWKNLFYNEKVDPPKVAVRSQTRKVVVHRAETGEREPTVAFDLASDPHERNPLPVGAEELRAVEKLVDEYLAGPGAGRASAEKAEIDPATRDRLRALGYGD